MLLDTSGLFGQTALSGKYPMVASQSTSCLLDALWDEPEDAALTLLQSQQVVPDAIELDLSGVAAGLEQHFAASSPPPHWDPCPECSAELGGFLRQSSRCCSTGGGPVATLEFPAGKSAAVELQQYVSHADPSQQQPLVIVKVEPQQQPQQLSPQQVPDMAAECNPIPPRDPAIAAAAAAFQWPCPEELKQGQLLHTSSLTAASMMPLVFPTAASLAAPASDTMALVPSNSITRSDSSQPGAAAQEPTVSDGAGGGSAAAIAGYPTLRPRTRATPALSAAAAGRSSQLLAPVAGAVRTREEAVARYRAKRARRSTVQRVRYQRRKEYADQRPRVGGRFVKMGGTPVSAQPPASS